MADSNQAWNLTSISMVIIVKLKALNTARFYIKNEMTNPGVECGWDPELTRTRGQWLVVVPPPHLLKVSVSSLGVGSHSANVKLWYMWQVRLT